MKRIKPIVLTDAKTLTISEMKQIRGGYEPEKEYPAACSAVCYNHTGAYVDDVNFSGCAGTANNYCDVITGQNGVIGVGCFNMSNSTPLLLFVGEYCQNDLEE